MDGLRKFNCSVAGMIYSVNKDATGEHIANMEKVTFGEVCALYAALFDVIPDDISNMPLLDVMEKMSEDPEFLDEYFEKAIEELKDYFENEDDE